jgi:hypothetical protein
MFILFSDVTSMGFNGCIKDVQLNRIARDLNENTGAKDIIPGCPAQVKKDSVNHIRF